MLSSGIPIRVAILGSGPCGLMTATELSRMSGFEVHVFERRTGFGRKLLVAGSSGLNISNGTSLPDFARAYSGFDSSFWLSLLEEFGPKEWIAFIENELGLETFLGTSNRYFVREMKASGLLKRWIGLLSDRGVRFRSASEWRGLDRREDGFDLRFENGAGNGTTERFDRVVFALGGGSWEEKTPGWVRTFEEIDIEVEPFSPANVGYEVAWKEAFLAEAEGKPLKKIRLETSLGSRDGELVVTRYGLEGTPIYSLGIPGDAFLDLRPDLTLEQTIERLSRVRENLSPIRRAKQKLGLCEASQALLFHHLPVEDRADLHRLASRLKRFPIRLERPRALEEAISSRGGVKLHELSSHLEFRKLPGVYCGGEMADWDAPTGGFLIQAAVSMGARIGRALREDHSPRKM